MALGDEVKKLKYDKRLLEQNVARGTLTTDERAKYLNDLPDLASNVENLGLVRGAAAASAAGSTSASSDTEDFADDEQDA